MGLVKLKIIYMPNIFEGHDPFILSYELDKIYDTNRKKFLEIYEYQKEEYAKQKGEVL